MSILDILQMLRFQVMLVSMTMPNILIEHFCSIGKRDLSSHAPRHRASKLSHNGSHERKTLHSTGILRYHFKPVSPAVVKLKYPAQDRVF